MSDSFVNTPIKTGENNAKIIYPVETDYPNVNAWNANKAEFYDSDGNPYGIPNGTEIVEGDWTGIKVPYGVEIILYSGTTDKNIVVPNTLLGIDVVSISGARFDEPIFTPGWESFYESIDMSNCLSLEVIENGAFGICRNISNVTFPNSIKVIGDYAFYQCDIKALHFPEGLMEVGKGAFILNSNLSDVNFPETLKTIGDNAFQQNNELTSIVLPNNILSIGSESFYRCSKLTSVTISRLDNPLTISTADAFGSTPISNGTDGAIIYYPASTNYPNEDGWIRNQCAWVVQ